MGILTKGELWAGHVLYLNDSKEFIHALELAEGVLQKRLEAATSDAERALITRLIDRAERAEQATKADVYAASLTTQGDLLSQWLSYCPGGGGFSIGFDGEKLAANARESCFTLRRCEYDPDAKRAIIEEIVESTLHGFREELEKSFKFEEAARDQGFLVKLIANIRSRAGPFFSSLSFWADITGKAPILKHESFCAEDEWRLIPEPFGQTIARGLERWATMQKGETFQIESGPQIPEFREGRGSLVPYVPVSLLADGVGKPPVVRIIVGPTRYPELALSALQRYTKKLGYDDVELKLTRATYRDM